MGSEATTDPFDLVAALTTEWETLRRKAVLCSAPSSRQVGVLGVHRVLGYHAEDGYRGT